MADGEYIVVCIDNSAEADRRGTYAAQIVALKHYCKTKLADNPKTEKWSVIGKLNSLSCENHIGGVGGSGMDGCTSPQDNEIEDRMILRTPKKVIGEMWRTKLSL